MRPMTQKHSEFAEFMSKRQRILIARQRGYRPPWTTDPILRDNRFCNVFREDDRVTIWIRENIRERYATSDRLWFLLAVARYINWPPSLEPMIASLNMTGQPAKVIQNVLEDRLQQGEKVYTGAYMIRAESDPKKPWYTWSKHKYIAEIVLGRLWEQRERIEETICNRTNPPTLQSTWEMLQDPYFIGWGPFMAYEWVTDLRHTRYLRNATDIYTWANAGPGAIRGLNRLDNRPLKTQPDRECTRAEMEQLMKELNQLHASWFDYAFPSNSATLPRFEMRDIEHCLCEFDKYERCRLGQGKMRSKYNWRKATPL